jgi:hypothetical protein
MRTGHKYYAMFVNGRTARFITARLEILKLQACVSLHKLRSPV